MIREVGPIGFTPEQRRIIDQPCVQAPFVRVSIELLATLIDEWSAPVQVRISPVLGGLPGEYEMIARTPVSPFGSEDRPRRGRS